MEMSRGNFLAPVPVPVIHHGLPFLCPSLVVKDNGKREERQNGEDPGELKSKSERYGLVSVNAAYLHTIC